VPLCALFVAGAWACGGDGGGGGGSDARSGTTTAPATTATTDPPASDEASRAEIEDVVADATALVDDLEQDPARIDRSGDDSLDRLRALYSTASPAPDTIESTLRDMAARGEHTQPGPSGTYRDLAIVRWNPPIDDDTVQFDTCAVLDHEVVGADGAVIGTVSRLVFALGEARRDAGEWRLYGLSDDTGRTTDIAPGSVAAGFCAAAADDSQEAPT
jgi:hypothetical protein